MGDVRVPDLNHVIIAGRLTRDPEVRYLQDGRPFCRISIANTRYFRTREGERKESTTFVEGTVWDKQAEYVGSRLRRGRPVILEGSLRTSEWEDRSSGQRRTRLELNISRVIPLDWDERTDSPESEVVEEPAAPSRAPIPEETEDDVPF